MLRNRISALFFLLCLILFALGAALSLPPYADGWEIEPPTIWQLIRGETSTAIEKQLEDKLAYKNEATSIWGAIRYGAFDTGSKGVVIGKDEWLFTKEEFESNDSFQQNIEISHQKITEIIAQLQAQDMAVVMLRIPAKARIHADKLGNKTQPEQQQSLSMPKGIPLLDTEPLFKEQAPAFMRTDTHWTPQTAKATAYAVRDYVEQLYPNLGLTNKSFITREEAETDYRGDLAEFVPTGWFKTWLGPKGESVTPYQTETTDTDSGSLFDDEQIDVVLIGTSYSAQKEWHFEGFLKEALQADVLNLADEGKGPFAPMEDFLESLKKGEVNAKLVIWEFPERFLPREHEEKS